MDIIILIVGLIGFVMILNIVRIIVRRTDPYTRSKLSRMNSIRRRGSFPKLRPTSRRMRTGGTAYNLHRDDFATDLLFLIALDAALSYDDEHFSDADYVDSPFANEEFDYSGSDFEESAVTVDPIIIESPEATTFENLSTSDDKDTKTSFGGTWGDDDSAGTWGDDDSGGWDDYGVKRSKLWLKNRIK